MSRSLIRSILLLALGAVIAACGRPAHVPLHDVSPVPTATPRPITLPADDAPHANLTEWWYYTGHLSSDDGPAYGFELVIFQVERQDVPNYYASHFAVTDPQRQQFQYAQKTWSLPQVPKTFDLGSGGWLIRGQSGYDQLAAAMDGYAIDLKVTPTKPPALHGTNGVLSFGPVGDSYYYSSTRLTVQGTMVDHGTVHQVTGEAWKDRQWGNFLASQGGGWDWLSLQLSDRSELMLFILRGSNGAVTPSYGTLIQPDGTTRSLPPGAAQVTVLGHWQSPHTGTVYPSGWSVVLPEQGLALRAEPVLADQELDTTASTGTVYWEGEVDLTGASHGKTVTGKGYVELTGYAASGP